MEAIITLNMELSDLNELELLRKKLDEIEAKKNLFLNKQEDNTKVEVSKECAMNSRITELMVKVFIALLDQAAADGDESYEKMASWIENIPYCSGMPLSDREKACFEWACIRSVPGEIDTEDAPDE